MLIGIVESTITSLYWHFTGLNQCDTKKLYLCPRNIPILIFYRHISDFFRSINLSPFPEMLDLLSLHCKFNLFYQNQLLYIVHHRIIENILIFRRNQRAVYVHTVRYKLIQKLVPEFSILKFALNFHDLKDKAGKCPLTCHIYIREVFLFAKLCCQIYILIKN